MRCVNRTRSGYQRHHHSTRCAAKWLALAVTPLAAAIWSGNACAQSLTWDASGANPTSPIDGSGNWDTLTGINWSNGTNDSPWIDGNSAVIGNGGTAGTITIDDLSGAVTAAGITINSTPGSDYTIAGESLNLTGSTPTIAVASGQSPTISSALSSSSGLTVAGGGQLNLTGNNANLTGTIAVDGGTLSVGAAGLGASTNAVVVGTTYPGTPSTTTTPGALALASGTSYTIGSFASQTNSTAVNTVTIPSGSTLNVVSTGTPPSSGINAAFVAGALLSNTTGFSGTNVITTSVTLTGGGALNVNGTSSGSSFLAGLGDANNTGNSPTFNMSTTLNMVGLSSFTFVTGLGPTPTGNPPAVGGSEFDVGVGIGSNTNLSLATNNSITAGTIDIGDSDPTPGTTAALVAGDAGTTTGTLLLGAGTNTLTANSILLGVGRGVAEILWATNTTTGMVDIAGPNGTAINMTIGMETGGTPGAASSLNLTNVTGSTGHSVTVTAGTIVLGDMISGGTGKSGSQTGGSISFDTGAFNVQTLVCSMANTAGNTSDDTVDGTFQVGTGPSSTGVLNVGSASTPGEFLLGDYTMAGGSGSGEKATLTIKGGTANIYCNILDESTAGSTGGTYGAFVSLTGGTLNMNGYDIGSTAAGTGGNRHISLTFPTSSSGATLENLGGTGINDAGLNVNSGSATGVLTLTGSNTYSGGTTITNGVLAITSDAVIPGGDADLSFNGGVLEFKNYASSYSFNNVTNLNLGAATGA
ncbi:MAG TPA: autotransporter-associated beta strand repeat-containing protein, partial [Tepidisphaeraceae bacterium]|nr:autotransporter-associated beta strand repeat-containing protein [Tepidisphaeraceae bacterium]